MSIESLPSNLEKIGRLSVKSLGRDPREPPIPWQQIWFRARRDHWATLALVPADTVTCAQSAAVMLQQVARLSEPDSVYFIDARGVALGRANDLAQQIQIRPADGRTVVIVLESPLSNPAAVPIIRCADAAILLVSLGLTTFDEAREVIELVGRDRLLGTIALRPVEVALSEG